MPVSLLIFNLNFSQSQGYKLYPLRGKSDAAGTKREIALRGQVQGIQETSDPKVKFAEWLKFISSGTQSFRIYLVATMQWLRKRSVTIECEFTNTFWFGLS